MYYLFINLQIKREYIYLAHPFMQPLANSDSVVLFTPLLPLLQSKLILKLKGFFTMKYNNGSQAVCTSNLCSLFYGIVSKSHCCSR